MDSVLERLSRESMGWSFGNLGSAVLSPTRSWKLSPQELDQLWPFSQEINRQLKGGFGRWRKGSFFVYKDAVMTGSQVKAMTLINQALVGLFRFNN